MMHGDLDLNCKSVGLDVECDQSVFIVVQSLKGKDDEKHLLNIIQDALTKELMDDYNIKKAGMSTGSLDNTEFRLKKLYKEARQLRRQESGYTLSELHLWLSYQISRFLKK
jgi:hypothetical protein